MARIAPSPVIARASLRRCAFVCWAILVMQMSASPAAAQGAMTNGDNHAGTISGPGELDLWTFSANQGDALSSAPRPPPRPKPPPGGLTS